MIITFDPGKTTGWARWYTHHNHGQKKLVELVGYGALCKWYGVEKVLKSAHEGSTVVIEKSIQGPFLDPVNFEVTGAIEALAEQRNLEVVFREPSLLSGIRSWPNFAEVRKMLRNPHAQDAIFHGALYLNVNLLMLKKQIKKLIAKGYPIIVTCSIEEKHKK